MSWNAGDCYWAQGLNEPVPHLRIVITKPDLSGRFIIVNMTSMREGADQTTVLNRSSVSDLSRRTKNRLAVEKSPETSMEEQENVCRFRE
jgi:hypothetical protein